MAYIAIESIIIMTPYLEEDNKEVVPLFTNEQVLDFDIPVLATLEYSPLEKNLLKADIVWTIIFYTIGFAIVLVLKYAANVEFFVDYAHYVGLVLGALLIMSLLFVRAEFKKKSYALRQKDIIYEKGLFWRSSTVIPFNRVQHCEVSQGPIDRFYNLSELKIFTAGGASSDLTIGGLLPETANRIKDFIVTKTVLDEEE